MDDYRSPSPRLEIFSMSLNNNDDVDEFRFFMHLLRRKGNPINFNDPFSILITDGRRVLEIFNSVKKNQYDQLRYSTLRDIGIQKKTKNPIQKKRNSKGRRGYSLLGPFKEEELTLMGPDGDISPMDFFCVIIHQNTGNDEADASQLLEATPTYRLGQPFYPCDSVFSWRVFSSSAYNRPFPFKVYGPFGSLTLDCIVYMFSRLVTVCVMLLIEGVQEDSATQSYICGNIYFQNTKFTKKKSVLLETPKRKALNVVHGMPIPLWRRTVAVPEGSMFKVGATLHDPINDFVVNGPPVFFKFDDFSQENSFEKSKVIAGRGASIKVKLSMKPNDRKNLLHGSLPGRI